MLQAEQMVPGVPPSYESYLPSLTKELQASNIFYAAQRPTGGGAVAVYFSAKTATGQVVLLELTVKSGYSACKVTVKSMSQMLSQLMLQALPALITKGANASA